MCEVDEAGGIRYWIGRERWNGKGYTGGDELVELGMERSLPSLLVCRPDVCWGVPRAESIPGGRVDLAR